MPMAGRDMLRAAVLLNRRREQTERSVRQFVEDRAAGMGRELGAGRNNKVAATVKGKSHAGRSRKKPA